MQYYLRDKFLPDGPYDLMAVIRKIRNGVISESTMLSDAPEGVLKPAGQWAELEEFFHAAGTDDVIISHVVHHKAPPRNLGQVLGQNIEFLRNNPAVAIYSGLFVILWLLIGALLLFGESIVKNLLGILLAYYLLGGYMFGVHKFVRGNPVRAGEIVPRMVETSAQMALASFVVALIMVPALVLTHYIFPADMLPVSLPILFSLLFIVLTLFAFVPLLVVQKGQNFLDAIQESCRVVLSNKGENLGLVFGLTALNFLFLPFLPVVLPVTSTALADIYEENLA